MVAFLTTTTKATFILLRSTFLDIPTINVGKIPHLNSFNSDGGDESGLEIVEREWTNENRGAFKEDKDEIEKYYKIFDIAINSSYIGY